MYLNKKSKVNKLAKEIYTEKSKKEVFLILHGYTGPTIGVKPLHDKLVKMGYSVYCPRYPGHGTNKEDFQKSTWKEWLGKSLESYLNLKAKYENVYLAGFSMGGVISSIICAHYDVEKLILIAPAFYLRDKKMQYYRFLKYLIPKKEIKNPPKYKDENWEKLSQEYYKYDFYNKKSDLNKLMEISRKKVKNIKAKTFVVLSKNDMSVDFEKTKKLIKSLKNTKYILELKKSSHVILSDIEKENVLEEIEKWI